MEDEFKIPFRDRLVHAWNIFRNKDPSPYWNYGAGTSGSMPSRKRLSVGAEKSIVTAVYNRIAVDVASLQFKHVQLDEYGRYLETLKDSKLNKCLTISANIDQTGRAFIEDAILSMLDEGVIALVPTDATDSPITHDSYEVKEMRVGKIKEWFPKHVRVEIYNDDTGQKSEYTYPKTAVCVIENPFYAVMNEPNSTAQRLMHKLSLLDGIDNRAGSDKLDMLIQFPQVIKTDLQRKLANKRIADLEQQMRSSPLGIGYIDGSEKVVQLNRSVENQLASQITELTSTLLSQLGMTMEILNGTADANTMNNYYNRTIEPIASALTDEMTRKFLTPTAITQGKAVRFFRDPLKLIPVTDVAEIADKFTRNEIATSNEIRQAIGMVPSKDPNADVLRNKNLSESSDQQTKTYDVDGNPIGNNYGGNYQNG